MPHHEGNEFQCTEIDALIYNMFLKTRAKISSSEVKKLEFFQDLDANALSPHMQSMILEQPTISEVAESSNALRT